jgi:hypothetical protein
MKQTHLFNPPCSCFKYTALISRRVRSSTCVISASALVLLSSGNDAMRFWKPASLHELRASRVRLSSAYGYCGYCEQDSAKGENRTPQARRRVTDDGSWIIVGVAGAAPVMQSRTGEARNGGDEWLCSICRVTVNVTPEWHGRAGRRDSRRTFGGVDHSTDAGKMRLETNSRGKWTREGNDIRGWKSLP